MVRFIILDKFAMHAIPATSTKLTNPESQVALAGQLKSCGCHFLPSTQALWGGRSGKSSLPGCSLLGNFGVDNLIFLITEIRTHLFRLDIMLCRVS